ncbi:MAG TPA: amino acid permease [Vicinamibacterales bacterium]|nr:amino acid permease [Vicinamibacterales bacterium]
MLQPVQTVSDEGLVRAIGLRSAVLLVVGSVIGSGIFLTTGDMATRIPSASLLLAAWVLGGVLVIAGGLTYAEMGAMFPRSGGVYVFLREAYGGLPAFLYGWTSLLVVISGSTAAVAVGFAEYLSYFLPTLSTSHIVLALPVPWGTFSISAGQLVAAASIAVLGAVNYVGVRSGNMVNVVLTAAKVAGLLAIPAMALAYGAVEPSYTPVVPVGTVRPLASFGIAMIAVLWTYEAWYYVTYAAGEIKDPQRNVPRALVIGVLALIGIYVVVNVAYLHALTIDDMKGVTRIAEKAASVLMGPAGAGFVALTVVISTFGCNAAGILGGSRVLFAMGLDGVFLPAASRVHPRYRTPHVAILALTVWSIVLALSGTYEQLFTYVMFSSILFNVATGAALFRLRRTHPDQPRPYLAWGYPVVPAVFVLGSGAFVLNTLIERPVESIAGLGLLLIGLPVYWYTRSGDRPIG